MVRWPSASVSAVLPLFLCQFYALIGPGSAAEGAHDVEHGVFNGRWYGQWPRRKGPWRSHYIEGSVLTINQQDQSRPNAEDYQTQMVPTGRGAFNIRYAGNSLEATVQPRQFPANGRKLAWSDGNVWIRSDFFDGHWLVHGQVHRILGRSLTRSDGQDSEISITNENCFTVGFNGIARVAKMQTNGRNLGWSDGSIWERLDFFDGSWVEECGQVHSIKAVTLTLAGHTSASHLTYKDRKTFAMERNGVILAGDLQKADASGITKLLWSNGEVWSLVSFDGHWSGRERGGEIREITGYDLRWENDELDMIKIISRDSFTVIHQGQMLVAKRDVLDSGETRLAWSNGDIWIKQEVARYIGDQIVSLLRIIRSLAFWCLDCFVLLVGTFMSLRSLRVPHINDHKQWLTFWVLWSSIGILERCSKALPFFLQSFWQRVPFYFELKALAVIYLLLFNGAGQVFQLILNPLINPCYSNGQQASKSQKHRLFESDPIKFISLFGVAEYEKAANCWRCKKE